jgi:hypothetical protein
LNTPAKQARLKSIDSFERNGWDKKLSVGEKRGQRSKQRTESRPSQMEA